jgi:hypothetical protein
VPQSYRGFLPKLASSKAARSLVNFAFELSSRNYTDSVCNAVAHQIQERQLRTLLRKARNTRFGRDHGFGTIRTVADFQKAVPLRTYEQLWQDYLRDAYPTFDNLTWPGRIPFLALTSGTTQGATKYIPVSREMVASNRKAGMTMLASYAQYRRLIHHRGSRLFHGKIFFLGGSTDLQEPAPGVREGDLSGIAALEVSPAIRPFTFPPLDIALDTNWDRKLDRLCVASLKEPITLIGGVPSWLLMLFDRVLEKSGKSNLAEVWPSLEVVCHGGVKFDPYRDAFAARLGSPNIDLLESYPCSEGFIGFGHSEGGLLNLIVNHGIFHEFVPVEELDSPTPTRHWLGTVQPGINYAIVVSTCAGMWSHVIGDTVRFTDTGRAQFIFTGRTKYTLSAFGEHLISEEVEAAIATAASQTSSTVRDWHVGPVFLGATGYHQFVVEFLKAPRDIIAFRNYLDAELCRKNADYEAHRAPGVGIPAPAVIAAQSGTFEQWMRHRGKLGGQNKVPRMDNTGAVTTDLVTFVEQTATTVAQVPPGNRSSGE